MNDETESIQALLSSETVENLLLIAVLGQGAIKSLAHQELLSRRCITESDEFAGAFMTNLSVVC